MKYIMFRQKTRDLVSYWPMIFAEAQTHAIMADIVLAHHPDSDLLEAVSAGDVYWPNGYAVCLGVSNSMGLVSHLDDGEIISAGSAMAFMWDDREGCTVYVKRE